MEVQFYALGETKPSLIITRTHWSDMCETIVDHLLGHDPYSGTAAVDMLDLVEMENADQTEYVEAIYLNGKLVGSLESPFWLNLDEYTKI